MEEHNRHASGSASTTSSPPTSAKETPEGVRGDLAFAQAVGETGYFTNSDTSINNFAGIAHYDHAASGRAFADPVIGVLAHIQLLKKYADGNYTPLANADVAPNGWSIGHNLGWPRRHLSLRHPTTGTSSAASMTRCSAPARRPSTTSPPPPDAQVPASPSPATTRSRRPALVRRAPRVVQPPQPRLPGLRHPGPHRHSRLRRHERCRDLNPTSGRCGIGVVFNDDDGAQYTYCHGNPGSHAIATGDRVEVGQYLMDSASTGNSSGPHLHFAGRSMVPLRSKELASRPTPRTSRRYSTTGLRLLQVERVEH